MEQAVDGAVTSGLVIVGGAGDLDALRSACPGARIVVLASDFAVDALRDAMNAGADGYLMKGVSPEALLQSLELVMVAEKVFLTNLAAMLFDLNNASSPVNSICGLSPTRAGDPSGAGDRLQQ